MPTMAELEEIRKKLREAGIPIGGWTETTEGEVESPLLKRQGEALQKIEVLLERQIKSDQEKIAELHAIMQRAKHGGGG